MLNIGHKSSRSDTHSKDLKEEGKDASLCDCRVQYLTGRLLANKEVGVKLSSVLVDQIIASVVREPGCFPILNLSSNLQTLMFSPTAGYSPPRTLIALLSGLNLACSGVAQKKKD